jgi:predicted transcriptional regulator
MRSCNVDSIIVPYTEDVPLTPSVTIGEKITRSIELMLNHNLSRIAVVRNRRAIGIIRLEDALQEIGLEIPAKS